MINTHGSLRFLLGDPQTGLPQGAYLPETRFEADVVAGSEDLGSWGMR